MVGSLIDGRYRIEHLVGEGGFGRVYRAFHIGLGAPVALKTLTLPDGSPEQLARLVGGFLDEARTLKRLRHPNIVAALDVGFLPSQRDGVQTPYLVMEWCSGPSLKRLLDARAGSGMAVGDAWRIFEPLLGALAHAHAEGIAHRDLKPANVVFEPDGAQSPGRPRVIDFGIAKFVAPDERAGSGATRTTSGRSPFTPQYASPEQLAGARTGPWTDVHALALIFVEMVVGRRALDHGGDTQLGLIDPTRPTPRLHGVEVGALEPVLARALAVRPSDRYPDAAAFAHAMGAAVADLAIAGSHGAAARGASSPLALPPAADDLDEKEPFPESTFRGDESLRTLRTTDTAGPKSAASLASAPPQPSAPLQPSAPRQDGAQAAPRPRAGARLIAAVTAGVLALASAGAVAALRKDGGWPFRQRLRDLSGDELERRAQGFGLGRCAKTSTSGMITTIACDRGMLVKVHLPSDSPEEIHNAAHNMATRMENRRGATRFFVDGTVALIVLGARSDLEAATRAVRDRFLFEKSGEPGSLPVPERSGATTLAGWTRGDLTASVHATGARIAQNHPQPERPSVDIYDPDEKSATVSLTKQMGSVVLSELRPTATEPRAYALDGSALLIVEGNAAYANVAFVCRLLAGTRVAEVGVKRLTGQGEVQVERSRCTEPSLPAR